MHKCRGREARGTGEIELFDGMIDLEAENLRHVESGCMKNSLADGSINARATLFLENFVDITRATPKPEWNIIIENDG